MRGWVALLWLAAACSRFDQQSVIDVADPAAAPRLLSGFYDLEKDFRWTGPSFRARLRTPRRSLGRPAQLVIQLYVPDTLLHAEGDTTLSCSIDGTPLPPQLYDKPGSQQLARDTPPLQQAEPILACALSHPMPPGPVELRELGIVVSKIRLIGR